MSTTPSEGVVLSHTDDDASWSTLTSSQQKQHLSLQQEQQATGVVPAAQHYNIVLMETASTPRQQHRRRRVVQPFEMEANNSSSYDSHVGAGSNGRTQSLSSGEVPPPPIQHQSSRQQPHTQQYYPALDGTTAATGLEQPSIPLSFENNRYYGGLQIDKDGRLPGLHEDPQKIQQSSSAAAMPEPSPLERMASWLSGNSSLRGGTDNDSLADFDESEWTPPDSSYGAAIPVGGWIPKQIRRSIEWTLIGLAVLGLVFLIVTTSIRVLEETESSHHHNSSYAHDDAGGLSLDDDRYIEYNNNNDYNYDDAVNDDHDDYLNDDQGGYNNNNDDNGNDGYDVYNADDDTDDYY